MTVSRSLQHRGALGAPSAAALIVVSAFTACAGGGDRSPGDTGADPGPVEPPATITTFGSESLRVALRRAPDSLLVASGFQVTAVVSNPTIGRVVVPYPCAERGLAIRVADAAGGSRDLARAACATGANAASSTVAPGDSAVVTVTGTAPAAVGPYRLQVGYDPGSTSQTGIRFVGERPLAVQYAFNCPRDGSIVPSINVAVVDATTSGLTRTPASARIAEGTFTDMLYAGPGAPDDMVPRGFHSSWERPGTYTVTVSASGYALWTQTNVVVSHDPGQCHANQVLLTARLVPAA